MFIKGSSGVSSHPKLHTYSEGFVLPVLSADELLLGSRHKGLLRQLRDMIAIPAEQYNPLYAQLINNFMEFVQVLPHKSNGVLGSMMNYALAQTTAVIQKYLEVRKKAATPLLKYAVFSAALLRELGRVMSNQRIVLVTQDGDYIADWNPLSGSMLGQGEYYKMYPLAAAYLRIESEVTLFLARQLMSREGFLWISSDLELFADWLAALQGRDDIGGKEITWILSLINREDIMAVLSTLEGASVDMTESIVTEYGEAFYQWLKAGLESGDIAINTDDANVHVVDEGVLLEKQLFKQFVDMTRAPVNFMVVFTQFGNLMGIAAKGGLDFLQMQYFSEKGGATVGASTFAQKSHGATREGMTVTNQADVLMNKEVSSKSNLKSTQSKTPANHQNPPSASNNLSSSLQAGHKQK